MDSDALTISFGVLGPLQVCVDNSVRLITAGKQRAVLATLLARANGIVPLGELVDIVWDESPPAAAPATVRNYIKRLRHSLGPVAGGRIQFRSPGYLLRVDEHELDLLSFAQLCRRGDAAHQAGDWQGAVELLGRALTLWRGPAFIDVPSQTLRLAELPRLDRLRVQAAERRVDAALQLGRRGSLIGELRSYVAMYPLHERFHTQLVLALAGAGQRVEAMEAYRHARRVLVDELGVEPGQDLQQLQQRILRDDPDLGAGPAPVALATGVTPAQLPAGLAAFTGREAELAALDALADGDGPTGRGAEPRAPLIAVVSGMPGVGKSALAVHWANRIAARFPDGQLHVNLRGFDPSSEPALPAEAIRGFLGALGVASTQLPPTIDAQAGLYRSLLATRAMLLVLDNARDADQVRPLLPGRSACLVLVTSRNRLAGLVAADGASPISIDVLTHRDAIELLAGRLGRHRLASEPRAAAELVELCARLPLALAIVGAHAALRPALSLTELAGELRAASTRLDAMETGEAATSLRAAFDCSYRILRPPARRMFRLLGVHPGPDVTVAAAASLAGIRVGEARPLLHELVRCHLVTEPAPGRFALHDMLRIYASERTGDEDSGAERRSAMCRMLEHYLHTAHTAAQLSPHYDADAPVPPPPGVTPEPVTDNAHALAWFEAEQQVLLAVIALAVREGFDSYACRLPAALAVYFDRRGLWHDYVSTQRTALAAGVRLADLAGQARAHLGLGQASTLLGSFAVAHRHYRQALDLFGRRSDRQGQARTHIGLAFVFERQRAYTESITQCMHALQLYRTIGDTARQAITINNIGWCHAQLGDYQQALSWCQQAVALHQEAGDAHGPAATASWDSLGYAYYQIGDHVRATDCLQVAVRLFGEYGDRHGQAQALIHLGDARLAGGEPSSARDVWQQALSILDDLNHPDAEPVRIKLRQLDSRERPLPGLRP